jgi:uncharacterized membrane protein YphA (DoxX/SURF4 family)
MQQQAGGQGRIVVITVWAATVLVSLGIGLAGIAKFAGTRWQALFAGWGYPQWFSLVVGAFEIAGGIALLIPRFSLYGVLVLGIVMLGAIGTLLRHPTPHFSIVMPAFYLALLIAIATARVRTRTSP